MFKQASRNATILSATMGIASALTAFSVGMFIDHEDTPREIILIMSGAAIASIVSVIIFLINRVLFQTISSNQKSHLCGVLDMIHQHFLPVVESGHFLNTRIYIVSSKKLVIAARLPDTTDLQEDKVSLKVSKDIASKAFRTRNSESVLVSSDEDLRHVYIQHFGYTEEETKNLNSNIRSIIAVPVLDSLYGVKAIIVAESSSSDIFMDTSARIILDKAATVISSAL